MNKKAIITTIILGLFLVLGAYCLVLQNKVNATEDIRQAQARINELKGLIIDAQNTYQTAMESIQECNDSWMMVANKAHNDAEMYRDEITEWEGFLLQR